MNAKINVYSIMKIQFAPCTGFGDEGRSATLFDINYSVVGTGYGSTDDEAVIEALMDAGLSFDEAFDDHYGVMDRCLTPDEEEDYVEFPNGEFPPQAGV